MVDLAKFGSSGILSEDLMEGWGKNPYRNGLSQATLSEVPASPEPTYKFGEDTMGVMEVEGYVGSDPIGPKPPEESPELKEMKESNELARKSMNMQLGLAGAKFLISIMNADNAYNAVKGQARLNILQARNQAADALFRGRQAQLDRQSEGYAAGESALLDMAAQGQDVSGQAVGKVQSSLETVGIFNGMQEEINSMREALGYELEEVAYEYQIDQAGAKAQSDKFNAGLELAASFIGAGL
jgi:hypothetical protein